MKIILGRCKYVCYRKILKTLRERNRIQVLTEIKDAVVPFVWSAEKSGRARSAETVKLELKAEAKLVR